MKKLMIAFAVAMAFVVSAFSESTTWFDAAINGYKTWPVTSELTGGAWQNTDSAQLASEGVVEVDAETSTPLRFAATTAKTKGDTANAMEFTSTIEFTPFSSLPEVIADAKVGIIAVKTVVEEVNKIRYYALAKQAASDANEWVAIGDDQPEGSTTATVTINIGAFADGANVRYRLAVTGGTAIDVYKTAYFATQAFQYVNYAGYGKVSALSATSEDFVTFTVPTITGADAVVTAGGVQLTAPFKAVYNADIVITYTAQEGKLFEDGSSTYVYNGKAVSGEIPVPTSGKSTSDAPAKIGSQLYLTLAAAIDAAQSGDTITLLQDCSTGEDYQISEGVTLDLNAKNLTVPANKVFTMVGTLKCNADGFNFINLGQMELDSRSVVYMGSELMFGTVSETNGKFTIQSGSAIQAANEGDPTKGMNYTLNGAATMTGDFVHYSEGPIVYNLDMFYLDNGATFTATAASVEQAKKCVLAADEGYAIEAKDGVYTAKPATVQAGTKYYLTLSDAIDALEGGETVKLLANVADAGGLTLGAACTLDLNGFELTIPSGKTFTVNGALTVSDTSDPQAGKLIVAGAIDANADINLYAIGYGTAGLVQHQGGSLDIAANVTVTFMAAWTGETAGQLDAYTAGFLVKTVNSKINTGTTYTYDGSMWVGANAVAKADVDRQVYGKQLVYTESYDNVADAIANVKDGGTLTLLANATLTSVATFNNSATFAGGDYTLTVDPSLTKAITIPTGKTVTLQSGTIDFKDHYNGYGIEVFGTVNVYATVKTSDGANPSSGKTGATPVFDMYDGAVINVYNGAELISNRDIFRGKAAKDDEIGGTYHVNIYGGTITSPCSGSDYALFKLYKKGTTNNVAITGGTIDVKPNMRISDNPDTIFVNLTLDDSCKAQFKADDYFKDKCAVGYKLAKDGEETYYTVKAATAATGVTLDQASASKTVGETLTLTATVAPAGADVTNTVWSSSDTAVATVTQAGVVTAVAAGTANIKVTIADRNGNVFEATCAVTVTAAGTTFTVATTGCSVSVKINDTTASAPYVAKVGETIKFTLTPSTTMDVPSYSGTFGNETLNNTSFTNGVYSYTVTDKSASEVSCQFTMIDAKNSDDVQPINVVPADTDPENVADASKNIETLAKDSNGTVQVANTQKIAGWISKRSISGDAIAAVGTTAEGALTTEQFEEAYLLDCATLSTAAITAAKAAFKFPAIVPGTVPAVAENTFNGTVTVKGADTVTATGDDWHAVTPGSTDSYKFYKAELTK